MIVTATLHDVGNGLAIDLQVRCEVPTEVGYSDDNETASRSGGVGCRDCRKENENKNKSAEIAG